MEGEEGASKLVCSVLQLRILDPEDAAQQMQSRQAKHSPLVMTPGGSFAKANKGRASFSPGDDELEEEDDEAEDGASASLGASQDLPTKTAACAIPAAAAAAAAAATSASVPASGTEAAAPFAPAQSEPQARVRPPQQVGLFGGAITTALPAAFEDISHVRQVPDHQEVFVDRDSEMSFIVEIVAYSGDVSNASAPGYYFTDLAECNEAKNVTVDSSAVITDASFAPLLGDKAVAKCAIAGRQTVSKFRQDDAPLEVVQIVLVVIRLPHVDTDLLLSVNVPYVDSLPPLKVEDVVARALEGAVGDENGSQCPAAKVISEAVRQLNIRNWSLFA